MRILSLILLLTLAAFATQAQTSLRVNLLGPVPSFEQNITKYQSIEIAYSPRVFLREAVNSYSPFSSMGGKSFGSPRSSSAIITFKSDVEGTPFKTGFSGTKMKVLNQDFVAYYLMSVKRNVDSRDEAYNRTGDDYIGTWKRTGYSLGVGFGQKSTYASGFTIDVNSVFGLGVATITTSGIKFDDFYGEPDPARRQTETKREMRPLLGFTVSLGYTFSKNKPSND